MGNSIKLPDFTSYENTSGKKLLVAIDLNNKEATQVAIDYCRSEFTKKSYALDYDEMMEKMENYLTRHYNIGDGIIFRKTPLEYCEHKQAEESALVIKENLQILRGVNRKKCGEENSAGRESATVGLITQERAVLAKERLKAFQATRKT